MPENNQWVGFIITGGGMPAYWDSTNLEYPDYTAIFKYCNFSNVDYLFNTGYPTNENGLVEDSDFQSVGQMNSPGSKFYIRRSNIQYYDVFGNGHEEDLHHVIIPFCEIH